jgi:hypothetical protein
MRGAWRTAALTLLGALLGAGPAQAADKEAINKAIDRGVAALKQLQRRDGTWPHTENGATSLAGLTLLECKVPANDPAVEKAAAVVREVSPRLTHTYSISLALLFLDRLGDARDVPLIESLTVRLLAGQSAAGGWSYNCPPVADSEVRRLGALLRQRNELKSGRTLPKPGRRTVRDLPREIQQQLALINRMAVGGGIPVGPAAVMMQDNSNTQFANLALWVARRHGLPVDPALRRVEAHYRRSQNADGGWGYKFMPGFMRPPPGAPPIPPGVGPNSSMAMTCAGLLGLAVSHGTRAARVPDKDRTLKTGLLALGGAIGDLPRGEGDDRRGPPILGERQGGIYYGLWSLERVAVALNLETIRKKDWYTWGSAILLANQQADGSWHGNYGACGADTCFALLFLRRSNLASDLTAHLGKIKDPTEVELTVGGVGGGSLTGRKKKIKHALAPEDKDSPSTDNRPKEPKKLKPIPVEIENAVAGKLSDALVQATGAEQAQVLKKLRDTKGPEYTEALLLALPRLDDDTRKKTREALIQRFRRLTAGSLLNYMKDIDPEARRAAILASAEKDLREHIPIIISKLSDPEPGVARAAHAALKALTEKDFGPAANATPAETDKAIAAWKGWWRKNSGK